MHNNSTLRAHETKQREADRLALQQAKELEARLLSQGRLQTVTAPTGAKWRTNNPEFIAAAHAHSKTEYKNKQLLSETTK